MLRLFLRMIMPSIVSALDKAKFKQRLVERINDNVNIPMLDEKTEERVFTELYETVIIVMLSI